MDSTLRVLYIARDESRWVFRGPHYFQRQLARVARVHFRRRPGSIQEILQEAPFRPDLIMLHMQPFNAAPEVTGLGETEIPKAMYIEDVHYRPKDVAAFVRENGIRIVFCPYREHFHRYQSQIADCFVWLPHCVEPEVFRDWGQEKEIDLLLTGQIVTPYYPVRKAMLERFRDRPGFVWHGHPGYVDVADDDPRFLVGTRYAREINRAKLFLTCGSKWQLPLAKYFEGPACMSCVLGPGGADFADLGFVDGDTFAACTVDDFEQRARELLGDPASLARITRRGHEMVMDRHTTAVRVREFVDAIQKRL